jgi:hypothetical protein
MVIASRQPVSPEATLHEGTLAERVVEQIEVSSGVIAGNGVGLPP